MMFAQNVSLNSAFSTEILSDVERKTDQEYLGSQEQQFIIALNLLRLHPQKWCDDFLVPYLKEHPDLKSSNSASLMRTLRKTKPMQELRPNPDLTQQAKEHAVHSGVKGYTGHKGFQQRAKAVEEKIQNVHEANSYGDVDGLGFLLNLLIDEGVPDLGHRKILLNPNLSLIGVHIADHKRYGKNVVCLLGNLKEN